MLSQNFEIVNIKITKFRYFIHLHRKEWVVLYNSANVAERIRAMLRIRKSTAKKMLKELGLGENMMTMMRTSMPKADNLAKIADYLDCSVDYLLGRTDVPEMGAFVLTYAARGGGVQTKIVSREEFAALQEQINRLPEETDEL